MTKGELWEAWKSAGVSYRDAKALFASYSEGNDTESIFETVFDMFADYSTRYSIIYKLRAYHNKKEENNVQNIQ